jgi:hypothetical protein
VIHCFCFEWHEENIVETNSNNPSATKNHTSDVLLSFGAPEGITNNSIADLRWKSEPY